MPISIRDQIDSLRRELKRDYEEKSKAIDDLERKLLGGQESAAPHTTRASRTSTPAPASPREVQQEQDEPLIGVTEAVRRVLRSDKPLDNAEITALITPLNPKPPKNKTLSRAVAGAVYKLKEMGQVVATKDGKYKKADVAP